jgi:hypothetical protein
MPPRNLSPEVDAYIDRAQPFAIPILVHLRQLVHKGCPGVVETVKWQMPFFEHAGVILCRMAAYKHHCNFGFWGKEMGPVLKEAGMVGEDGSSFDRITTKKDLPPEKVMMSLIKQAAGFIDRGEHTSPIAARHQKAKAPKPRLETPAEFEAALRKNKKAAATFAAFSPSCRREYNEWIASAKRPETRDSRIATAVEWITEGKQRNWKYQNC